MTDDDEDMVLVGTGTRTYAKECFTCEVSGECVGGRPRPCPQRKPIDALPHEDFHITREQHAAADRTEITVQEWEPDHVADASNMSIAVASPI